VQFLEPTLLSPVGASGGFDHDGRPLIYRRALQHMLEGRVRVSPIVTHRCGFEGLPRVFDREYREPDFVKAVLLPGS
jgi:L-iditol 2-dehydrogenase